MHKSGYSCIRSTEGTETHGKDDTEKERKNRWAVKEQQQ